MHESISTAQEYAEYISSGGQVSSMLFSMNSGYVMGLFVLSVTLFERTNSHLGILTLEDPA